MNDVIKTEDNGITTWKSQQMGLFAAILQGANIAEVEIYDGYHSAADLREIAMLLNEVAEVLDPSPIPSNELLETIHYLEGTEGLGSFNITFGGLDTTSPSLRLALIALAKWLREREQDGEK